MKTFYWYFYLYLFQNDVLSLLFTYQNITFWQVIIPIYIDSHTASINLQNHLDLRIVWYKNCRFKIN